VIRSNREENASRLAATLAGLDTVREFRVSPTGD